MSGRTGDGVVVCSECGGLAYAWLTIENRDTGDAAPVSVCMPCLRRVERDFEQRARPQLAKATSLGLRMFPGALWPPNSEGVEDGEPKPRVPEPGIGWQYPACRKQS